MNGSVEDLKNQIFGNRKPKRSSRAIFDWYLMVLACLLPLDVAIRRVQLDLGWVKKLFNRSRRESTSTIGALLARTGEVRFSMNSRRDLNSAAARSEAGSGRPMATQKAAPRPVAAVAKPDDSTSQPSVSAPPAAGDGGTTSRLLAMKKKREQDGEEKK